MEELLYYLEDNNWVLTSVDHKTYLRYIYPGYSLTVIVNCELKDVTISAPSKEEGYSFQYYFGVSPSIDDVKDALRLSWNSYHKVKDHSSIIRYSSPV